MCGMFVTCYIDEEVTLPHFPEEIDHSEIGWQCKQGLDLYAGPYRITSDGRVEQQKYSKREKTDTEKLEEAEKWGFDSWDEYVTAYEQTDENIIPEELDDDTTDEYPPPHPSTTKTDKTWWADISYHGTFEFHTILKRDPVSETEVKSPVSGEFVPMPDEYMLDVYCSYEADVDQGELQEIRFMGDRFADADNPVESAIEQIEEWRRWKDDDE